MSCHLDLVEEYALYAPSPAVMPRPTGPPRKPMAAEPTPARPRPAIRAPAPPRPSAVPPAARPRFIVSLVVSTARAPNSPLCFSEATPRLFRLAEARVAALVSASEL